MDEKALTIMVSLSAAVAIGMRSIEALVGKTLFYRREEGSRAEGMGNKFSGDDRRKLTLIYENDLKRTALYERIVNLLEQIEKNTEKLKNQNRGGS